MMRQTLSLDGDWERRDFLDEAWRWSDALRPSAGEASTAGPPAKAGVSAGWRAARVPGSAIDDAWRAGEIPNPYVDRNSLAAEWVPERTWLYRRRFTVPGDGLPRAALRFEGIDPGGTVFLDGEEIARHAGMFVPLEIDLDARLEPGSTHDLVVVVDSAPPMPSQVGRTELARHHRSRMGYGWDFCPRMIHTGIWRSVSLERYRSRLRDIRLDGTLAADHRTATIEVSAHVDGAEARGIAVSVVGPDGSVVAEDRAAVTEGHVRFELHVDAPMLWWPNGLGDQPMYRLVLSLAGDEADDVRTVPFGIRSVELARTEGSRDDGLPYTLTVNGRATWIRGWNWTPMDACFGVPRPERLAHLVELLRRANVNLVRVWGGGLIESEAFYDACDRAGILVWQEFAQSSSGIGNMPAADDEFVALMRREAEAIVPLRAHHPSLAIWCGGNELADPDGRPLTDAHPVLAALRDVVARLDPDAAWLPTSPSGPRFDNSLDAIADDPAALHDVHGPWEHQGLGAQHFLADATTSLLHSEFGVEGMTNPPALRATVSDPDQWCADRSDPVIAHRGAWWNNRAFVERAFGGDLSLEELARASQHLQADGLRTVIDGDRRRWPRNAGTLPWVFNEPFPNAWSNAAVDYFGVAKAAYHAVAESYAPVIAGVAFDSQALAGAHELTLTPWLANDTDGAVDGPVVVTLHDSSGRCLAEHRLPLPAAANTVVTGAPITIAIPDDAADVLVLATAVGDQGTRRLLSRTDSLAPFRSLPATTVEATVTGSGDRWSVEITDTGRNAAAELFLDDPRPVGWPERSGAAYLEANLVTLLPGEARRIDVAWHGVPAPERRLRLSGWNVEERELRGG